MCLYLGSGVSSNSAGASPSSYRTGKRNRHGSTGAIRRLCSASAVTSLQNIAKLSSALILFNVLMVMAERDFLCRHTYSSCQYAGADCDPTPSYMYTNSNCCMCTCTPRIRAFISVTAQLSNDQYHNSWNTL